MSKFGKFLNGANSLGNAPAKAVDATLNGLDTLGGKVLRKPAKAYGKSLVRKDPTGQNFGNAFTGFQEGGGMIATAAIGGGLYAGIGSAYAVRMPENPGQVSYTGTAPIHNADGVSNAPTLGASGSMVFGMHQGRKG
jgi:hypothetical protein